MLMLYCSICLWCAHTPDGHNFFFQYKLCVVNDHVVCYKNIHQRTSQLLHFPTHPTSSSASNLCIPSLHTFLCFIIETVPCGSGAFSLEEGRIAPLPLPRHVVRGDYLEWQIKKLFLDHVFILPNLCYLNCAYN